MKYRAWLLSSVLAAAAGFSVSSSAFLFGKKEPRPSKPVPAPSRRYVFQVPDKAFERELLDTIVWRNTVRNQTRVLRELAAEKETELARFHKELMSSFGMKDDRNYFYDLKQRIIYELSPKTGGTKAAAARPPAETGPDDRFDRRAFREIKDDAEHKQFVRLSTGKKLVTEELGVFQLVLREKQREMTRIGEKMKQKFSMALDRDYEYDARTMRLFDVTTNAPASLPAPAERLETPVRR